MTPPGTSAQYYRATRFHVTVRPLVGCNNYVRTVSPVITLTQRASLALELHSHVEADAVARLARAAGYRAQPRQTHRPQRRTE